MSTLSDFCIGLTTSGSSRHPGQIHYKIEGLPEGLSKVGTKSEQQTLHPFFYIK